MSDTHHLLIGLASIPALGIAAQWLARRLGLPSILLLLTVGFLAGPVTGFLHPDELAGDLLFPVISLSVAVLLFEGGLSLKLDELKEIGRPVIRLLTLGVLITATLATIGAIVILGMPPSTALILGCLLTVTGPTVIGPMIRHIRPSGKVGRVAYWEGIVGDPIGALLAVLAFEAQPLLLAIEFDDAIGEAALGMLTTAAVGVGIGGIAALLLTELLRRYWVPDDLHSPVVLAVVLAAFAASDMIQKESGLLTVTLMGIFLASQRRVQVRHILEFKENLRVLLLSGLFIVLAARVTPAEFTELGWAGPGFVAFMILVVRPVAVFSVMPGAGLTYREQLFLAWLAPRGIVAASVASVFAFGLGPDGGGLVPAVFLVVVGTALVYGLTTGPLARWLGLSSADPQGVLIVGAHPGARAIAHALKQAGFRVVVVDTYRPSAVQAQLEGLTALHSHALSPRLMSSVDFSGIGKFMAMTSDDELNSLATLHFRELFGRASIWQLTPERAGKHDRQSHEHVHGRAPFRPGLTYRDLDERFERGEVVKATRLSEEFDYVEYLDLYGDPLPMFVVTRAGKLRVQAAESPVPPEPGDLVIGLVDASRKSNGERE